MMDQFDWPKPPRPEPPPPPILVPQPATETFGPATASAVHHEAHQGSLGYGEKIVLAVGIVIVSVAVIVHLLTRA